MGIRIDQLHSEVFEKISKDLNLAAENFKNYLDARISDMDVVFGLPETIHFHKNSELSKRTLEKSGFVELNRDFIPYGMKTQDETGVWISNLDMNFSPFEAATINGQKRGINVAGYSLNYTRGNIAQNIDKMFKLPIAPNLPVFFPEDNNMEYNFSPKKSDTTTEIIVDTSIYVPSITAKLTDSLKKEVMLSNLGSETVHSFLDSNGELYYIKSNNKTYNQNNLINQITDIYNRYAVSFADVFRFEKIITNSGYVNYVDYSVDNRLFNILNAGVVGSDRVELKLNNVKVYHTTVQAERLIDGVLTTVMQPSLVKYEVKQSYVGNLVSETIVPTMVSQLKLPVTTEDIDGNTFNYIQDNGIKMYLEPSKLYYYFPYSSDYKTNSDGSNVYEQMILPDGTTIDAWYDNEGNVYPEQGGDVTRQKRRVTIVNENIRVYLTPGSAGAETKTLVDNLTGYMVEREMYSEDVLEVVYYRSDIFMDGDTSNICDLSQDGVYSINNTIVTPNKYRVVKLNIENKLSAPVNGTDTVIDFGKPVFYNTFVKDGKEFATKYYLTKYGKKYFETITGEIFFVDADVKEIYKVILENKDTTEIVDSLLFSNGDYRFIYISAIREYFSDDLYRMIQMRDIDGDLIYKMADGTKVYQLDQSTMVKKENGVSTPIIFSYIGLIPEFETKLVPGFVLSPNVFIPFNIVNGNVEVKRNGTILSKYDDYEVESTLTLLKPLEFNEETKKGDTLYIKRFGKKDLIIRLEKHGSLLQDISGHWANDTGVIIMPEVLSGNNYDFVDGYVLLTGEQLTGGNIVKKGLRFYKYKGTPIYYRAGDITNNTIYVNESGIFWEDVTAYEVEWERKHNNYTIFSAKKGDTIRFTTINRIRETSTVTGEPTVVEKEPYSLEMVCLNDGLNVFTISDTNFDYQSNSIESYILVVENIRPYTTFVKNRANNFNLILTGLQTVAKNDDAAMIYGDDYFFGENILMLKNVNMDDNIALTRIQAPQGELKIEFISASENQSVEVPFDIVKNKYDIVIPEVLNGHEYTWFMGEYLPEGRLLKNGDVVCDKAALRFFKYNGISKQSKKEGLVKQSTIITFDTQKEILRQVNNIPSNLEAGKWFLNLDKFITSLAVQKAKEKGDAVVFYDENGIFINDTKTTYYYKVVVDELLVLAADLLDDNATKLSSTVYLSEAALTEIRRILATDNVQSVLKKIKYGPDGKPMLDEAGEIVYYMEPTRKFHIEINPITKKSISRNLNGLEVDTNEWTEITKEDVKYYRYGKTFTIVDTKEKDQIVVRLKDTGAEVFTSNSIISAGGEIIFAIDFNIEEDDGSEIDFEVIHNHINWTNNLDYIQEGQKLTLNMVDKIGQKVIIRRNDEFSISDIVVLERKDLVFIEVWHEDISETGFIFPCGNVQFASESFNGIATVPFDHVFFTNLDGENIVVPNGHVTYAQAYQKGNIVYNYYENEMFESISDENRKYIDSTFVEDQGVSFGWRLSSLSEADKKIIFDNPDNNLYFDGDKIIQIRYRTRIAGLNLFENYFKGTSEYMSKGLKFQGKSPVIGRTIVKEIGEQTTSDGDDAGKPITKVFNLSYGGNLIIADSKNSLLYKEGKLFDDALFTVEEKTDLSYNGYVYAIPVAIVNRRNQGVYHPEFNTNGTSFFINGIYVSEDKEDFADDISGFTLVDEKSATLETSSVGRDRKAKFKIMLEWLFMAGYKAGGSMVSRTTNRPDGLLFDEINVLDIIDLRIDANDQRKRIELLESASINAFGQISDLRNETSARFSQTNDLISTTSNLIYSHIIRTEESIRKDMNLKDSELTLGLEKTNVLLSDLSANVYTKSIVKNLLADTIIGLTDYNVDEAFVDSIRPTRDDILGMIDAFAENMEGSYTKTEFIKFLVTSLKTVVDKKMMEEDVLYRWLKRLSVKDLSDNPDESIFSRSEALELIYEGLVLASKSRILPAPGSEDPSKWVFSARRYDGFLGTKILDPLVDITKEPIAIKDVNINTLTKTYETVGGETKNIGYLAGPSIWGDVHKYHATYTAYIFVSEPFELEYVKMNGDDPHAIYINDQKVAASKYCCRDTVYSYKFSVPGWYKIEGIYSENTGGHNFQFGWNPKDYVQNIKFMTTQNMDELVEITQARLDNWALKTKTLVSTIDGDASGYFTKWESKLIIYEGLLRIRNHITSAGLTPSESELSNFHIGTEINPGLESWLDNKNNDGKFTSLGYTVQNDMVTNAARSDEFRPVVDLSGYYNINEVIIIVKKAFELSNGIDSLNRLELEKWVERLNLKLAMSSDRYMTSAQVDAFISAGIDYFSGLDKVTTYEISHWLDTYIKENLYPSGIDQTVSTTQNVYSKAEFKNEIIAKFASILGA